MIVEFSVQNFRSIKELQTISFVATGLKSPSDYPDVDNNNIELEDGMRFLKTVGIYGANASGKSNIIRALVCFLQAIRNEASSESNLNSLCDPFLYQDVPNFTESFFQLVLFIKNKKYRYGFTVRKNDKVKQSPDEKNSSELVVNEWLYGTKEKNIVEYYTRKGLEVKKGYFPKFESIPSIPYDHSLFLTHAAAFDSDGDCAIIRNYISGWTISNVLIGLERFRFNALILIEKEDKKKDFLELLNSFNLKFEDIIFERDSNKPEPSVLPMDKIFLIKNYQNFEIKLNLRKNESSGTQKLFDLAGLLLRAFNLTTPAFIILDELDSNFHPFLLIKLVGLFNNPLLNKSKSQLLFTSHDTNLMSPSIMRRDQFYFTEKREDNSTRLYSLSDLKGIRNGADFAKEYLAGFYGALPLLESFTAENNFTQL